MFTNGVLAGGSGEGAGATTILLRFPLIRVSHRAHVYEEIYIPYARRTTVTAEKTKTEIETTLTRYGAARFAYFVEPTGAVIMLEVHDRRLRFNLPLEEGTGAKADRLRRQRWRALLLCIKAKLGRS
jgi:hypothetical protein